MSMNDVEEARFVDCLVGFFSPKVVKAAGEGFAWWEIEADIKEELDKKAKWRLGQEPGLTRHTRRSAMKGYARLHGRVLVDLKKVYPARSPENN